MAKVFANTLSEPDRHHVEALVLSAVDRHPESRSWGVFILQVPGVPGVYVSIESADAVLRSWLFADAQEPIEERIRRDLQ